MTLKLDYADSDENVLLCFPLMQELRPHLTNPEQFVLQVRRQQQQGYRLLAIWEGGIPVGLGGYRQQENTIYGKFIYVDDLVVSKNKRGSGLGEMLLDAIRLEAQQLGCKRLVLDTGMANSLAQRFYFRQGMLALGLHFNETLEAK